MTKTGRFAPSPTGRMHLGNIFTALLSWLSVRKAGGRWILRIEDLDQGRSRPQYARMIEDDLRWLGLDWDEGGADSYLCQSRRSHVYAAALTGLQQTGLCYPCRCRRADIMATQAPHQSDGRIVYSGHCRPTALPQPWRRPDTPCAVRVAVPDSTITFSDAVYGPQSVNLAHHCGDFVVQRADGAWAYQLAVTVDDADMGVTEVVRGSDLLLSTAQQLYLYRLLNLTPPAFAHVPILVNAEGRRLSKRDSSESMEALRERHTPQSLLGRLAHLAGLTPTDAPATLHELIPLFSFDKLPHAMSLTAV